MEDFIASIVRPNVRGILCNMDLIKLASSKNPVVVTKHSLNEFVGLVGKKGYLFCPSTFHDHKKGEETYQQSQLAALYFNGISISGKKPVLYDEIYDRAKRYDLPILFAYDCYSLDISDKTERFCIVFLLNNGFVELKEAEAVQRNALLL